MLQAQFGYEDWSILELQETIWVEGIDDTRTVWTTSFGRDDFGVWSRVDLSSDRNWRTATNAEDGTFASCNGYGAGRMEPSDDWLVSPIIITRPSSRVIFELETKKDFDGPDLQIWVIKAKISPEETAGEASIFDLTPQASLPANRESWRASGELEVPAEIRAQGPFRIGIRYVSNGGRTGDAARWGVRSLKVTSIARD